MFSPLVEIADVELSGLIAQSLREGNSPLMMRWKPTWSLKPCRNKNI